MQWSDERYVKLYSRDTAAWLMWPWQARALLPLLLRKADGAGLLDLGKRDQLAALSVLVGLPSEVVAPGLAALLEDGTLEPVERGFLLPGFIEAQEATKTEARKKRDQRERQRDQARETTRHDVPQCPAVSPSVPLQPSPAQPSPVTTMSSTLDLGLQDEERPPRLEDALTDAEFQVFEHWRQVLKHPKAKPTPERKRIIAKALKAYTVAELQAAIDGCKRSPHHMGENDRRMVYDDIELILRDAKHVEMFQAVPR